MAYSERERLELKELLRRVAADVAKILEIESREAERIGTLETRPLPILSAIREVVAFLAFPIVPLHARRTIKFHHLASTLWTEKPWSLSCSDNAKLYVGR